MASCSSPKPSRFNDDIYSEEEDYDDYNSDEDEDCVLNEYREMTDEEVMQYLHAFHQTQGFDMPSFHDSHADGRIEVITGNHLYSDERISRCAKAAVDHYNNEYGTNFEFVRIVSANNQAAMGTKYYLTFEVKEEGTLPNSCTTLFQARVLSRCAKRGIEVQLCRPKPPT